MDSPPTSLVTPTVSLRALFFRFLAAGLSGFGGVLPFARHMLVEKCQWLTEVEFAEVLALAQFLPGPNIVNVSVIVGRRFQGPRGALAAVLGLMLMPMIIVMALATLYDHYSDVPMVRDAMNGVAAAASGLILAVGIKMAGTIRGSVAALALAAVAFAAIGVARMPLLWVLAAMAPLSIGYYWFKRR